MIMGIQRGETCNLERPKAGKYESFGVVRSENLKIWELLPRTRGLLGTVVGQGRAGRTPSNVDVSRPGL